jgi:hypothetical protein
MVIKEVDNFWWRWAGFVIDFWCYFNYLQIPALTDLLYLLSTNLKHISRICGAEFANGDRTGNRTHNHRQ